MNSKQIESLSQIDLNSVTAEELKWTCGSFRAISKGQGRYKTSSSRNGVYTPIGDIQIDVWVEAVKAVIHRDGLDGELKHLTAFYLDSPVPAFSKEELKIRAMDAVLSGLYKDPAWSGFIKYNGKYHPELLDAASLVQVYTSCCGAPCTFTKAWLERGEHYAYCPQCGAWTMIRQTKEAVFAGEEE